LNVFWNFIALHNHYRDCHPTFKIFVCLYCGRVFDSITSLSSHFRGHKLSITDDYECKVCHSEFKNLEFFKSHQCKSKTTLVIVNESQICPTCGKSFASSASLTTHIKIHLPPDAPKTCEFCQKTFSNKYKLKQHSITHNRHLRPFCCNVCGMTFQLKNLLKRHLMTHTGERPFECENKDCDKRFATKYDMRVHARLHTGFFPYQCSHCDSCYPAWSNLYKHAKSKHNLDIRSASYKQLMRSRINENE
jgi:KRAB domain-containing zinc finger protein